MFQLPALDSTRYPTVCTAVHPSDMGAFAGVVDRNTALPRSAYRCRGTARDGLGAGEAIREIPPRLESGTLVGLMRRTDPVGQLLKLLPPGWAIIIAIDETLERRKGERIAAKGVYRDAVRSSKRKVVTCMGLQWIYMALLVPWS